MAVVLEVLFDVRVGYYPAGRGNLCLLHIDDNVVLQRLGGTFNKHVVRRKARTANPHAAPGNYVFDLIAKAALALSERYSLQVTTKGLFYLCACLAIYRAGALIEGESPVVVLDDRVAIQQVNACVEASSAQDFE